MTRGGTCAGDATTVISQATPISPADAPVGPDHLAGAILRSLGRSMGSGWGMVRTLVLGVLTLGIYPILEWSQRFRDHTRYERQQLWHLAEWLRLQTGTDEATKLRDDVERLRFRRPLAIAAMLWVLATIGAGALQFLELPFSIAHLSELTYAAGWDDPIDSFTGRGPFLFAAWTVGLTVAYGLHCVQVQLWAGDVRRLVARMNPIFQREGAGPIDLPRLGSGLSARWVIGAIVMVLLGAWWGVGLMLAGGAQRRYTTRSAARLRYELAQRVQLMLMARRPMMRVPMPVVIAGICGRETCQAPLPSGAAFCPRCGQAVAGPRLSEVA